jgi:hypothetical protein
MGTSKRAFAMISILYWISRKCFVVIKVKLETRSSDQDIQTSDHHPGLVMWTSARCNHMLLLDTLCVTEISLGPSISHNDMFTYR